MKSRGKITRHLGILIAVMCLFANCLSYGKIEDTVTRTFAAGSGGTLTIESDIGSIRVEGTDTDSVGIEILRHVRTNNQKRANEILDNFEIQFRHSGNDVTVEAKYKKRGLRGFWNRIGNAFQVRFVVVVPTEYNVDLSTKGGSIAIRNIRGEVLSKTSGGRLDFDRIEGDITGNTSGGSISIGEVMGSTRIRTSGGSIRISTAQGVVDAHTSGGSITVDEVMGAIKAHTSGGSIKARITKQPEADCSLTTSGGSITVYMPGDLSLDLDAKTSGGNLHTDVPVSINGEIDKRSMRGEMNGGGPELYLRTSGGSIYLKKR